MSQIFDKANELKDYMVSYRRHFHQNPELSFKEFKTTEFIKNELTQMGIEQIPVDSPTGCVAIIKGGKPGSAVTAIRADIDALPIEEGTGLPYASVNKGVMHACGHDGHAAALLGTAKLLHSIKDSFSGTVKLIFQPAEEGLGGALQMIRGGALNDPTLDEIIALHSGPQDVAGKIGIMPEKAMACADSFKVTVRGKSGHAARPHQCINPVTATGAMVTAIANIVANEVSAFDTAVVSVCTLSAGNAFNVIPEESSFSGTVRCLENDNRAVIKSAIERIVSGIAASFKCTYEYDYTMGVSSLRNTPAVNEKIAKAGADAIGMENVMYVEEPTMGAEDFSEFVTAVGAGAMFRLCTNIPGVEPINLHNYKYNFNDDALPAGAAVLCQYILNKHI